VSEVLIQTAQRMHAHRCQQCASNGKSVVWIHPDICRGIVAAHKCPECGNVEWKQDAIESAKLPQPPQVQTAQGINLETVLGYILLFVGLALVGYGVYQYVSDRQAKKALPLE
jgi:hypothetical protein